MIPLIELGAVISSAAFGALRAVRREMDFVGVFWIAFLTAFGGGTLRDLFLDRHPLYWIANPRYVVLVFALAARGEVVIVGRGAGFLLPGDTTLNVRVIAPHAERVAYLAQWLRMSADEAATELAARDRVRAALHAALTGKAASDPTQYDLILNSGRLGEAARADLIVSAIKAKHLAEPQETPNFDAA